MSLVGDEGRRRRPPPPMDAGQDPGWDHELLREIARTLHVDERTIKRNVRLLVEGMGLSLGGAAGTG